MTEYVSLALSIIAAITAFVSAVIVYLQTRIQKQTNSLPILVDMFREFRSLEFKEHQRYVYNQLRAECNPSETGYSNLPESAREHVLPVSFFFDNLGVLVASGVIDETLVLSFMGDPIQSTWTALEPYILHERKSRGPSYQKYYEHLVARARENPVPELVRKMKLQDIG